MITTLLFVLGLALLIKGADLLVDGASFVAKRFNVSNIVIGLTIVAFGTSMPELVVNLIAAVNGNTQIAIGNILGSNIANIFLILGISAIIFPLTAKKNTVYKEIPLSLLAALVVAISANDIFLDGAASNAITRTDGLVFLGFFAIFMYYTLGIAKGDEGGDEVELKFSSMYTAAAAIIGGLIALIFGGKWIVDGAIVFASAMGMSESLIGLTVVAVGTSLPELATSAIAAYKKQSDIAIGNVVGSNIFNIFWILGVSSSITALPFQAAANIDIAVTAFASLVLFLLMYVGKKHTIERWQGALMVCLYVLYVVFLIIQQ